MADSKADIKKKEDNPNETMSTGSKSQEAPKFNIFGTLGTGTSVFNTNGANIFNNNGITPPLFSNVFDPKGSLFGETKPIFDANNKIDLTKPQPISSLFQSGLQKQDSGSEGEGEEGADEQKPEEEEPKEIIMRYEYEESTEQICKVFLFFLNFQIKQGNIEKFRRNAQDIVQKGYITIEKPKQGTKYFLVYRNQIQQLIYTGQLVKGITTVGPLGAKPENIIVKAVSFKQEEEELSILEKKDEQKDTKKKLPFQIDTIKLMFVEADEAKKFKEQIAKIIE